MMMMLMTRACDQHPAHVVLAPWFGWVQPALSAATGEVLVCRGCGVRHPDFAGMSGHPRLAAAACEHPTFELMPACLKYAHTCMRVAHIDMFGTCFFNSTSGSTAWVKLQAAWIVSDLAFTGAVKKQQRSVVL